MASAQREALPLLQRVTATLKRIAGMPNYEGYVAHLQSHHPGCAIPTEREYYELYLKAKYEGGPGSRCC